MPSRSVKYQCPPESSVAPSLANGEPNFAFSATYTTSVASSRPSPTPRQAPCAAANVGAGNALIFFSSGCTSPPRYASASSLSGVTPEMSRPAQKARPSPLSSSARTSPREAAAAASSYACV